MSFNSADTPGSLYCLVDEHGQGILVPWVKFSRATGDYSILEEYLDTAVKSYLYNGGKGKLVSICELVKIRNKQRNALLSAIRRKKGRGKTGPNILDDINQENDTSAFLKALKVLDGGSVGGRRVRYRELVWDIDARGKMGECLLHICLLHNTADMNELTRCMVQRFPKIVNDIFISEEYYGLSPLHQAIVNEDVSMAYFLLKNGANVHQRCYGSFFCADDQKASRRDSLEHEWVDMDPSITYSGKMYWGEYPLSFAACTGQEEIFRLLRVYSADPNMPDSNGNTVLHLAVIHDLPNMLELAYSQGAQLHYRNNAKLTPLGLSARLANKNMFDLIVELEMDIVWRYGDIVCKAYPLADIDTIREQDGSINASSVLANVVYGSKAEHLELFEGVLDELLNQKWESFGRTKMFWSLFGFLYFFIVYCVAFMTRDFQELKDEDHFPDENITSLLSTYVLSFEEIAFLQRSSSGDQIPAQCHLWKYTSQRQKIRMVCELLAVVAVIIRCTKDLLDMQRTGTKRWWNSIKSFPEKLLHKTAQLLVLLMVPIRFFCFFDEFMLVAENVLAMAVVFATTSHFLFYCRGLKFVGPFVLMVYKIVVGDMMRFLFIYSFFIIGAEKEYCRHNGVDPTSDYPNKFENIMQTTRESLMRMFIMSVGEFGALYKNLNDCKAVIAYQGKVFFFLYELLVTIMLLNLLIAMMTRTYEKIAEAEKEWKRQWAKVILMLEQSLSPEERQLAMFGYSRPIRCDKLRRAFVVRFKQSITDEPKKIELNRKKHSLRLSQTSALHMAGLR